MIVVLEEPYFVLDFYSAIVDGVFSYRKKRDEKTTALLFHFVVLGFFLVRYCGINKKSSYVTEMTE